MPKSRFSHDVAHYSKSVKKNDFGLCVSEDSDQPGHPSSLISLHCSTEESLGPLHAYQRIRSDWMDSPKHDEFVMSTIYFFLHIKKLYEEVHLKFFVKLKH